MTHALTDEQANLLLTIRVTPRQVVRAAGFPEADDEFADFILWEKTPFPLIQGVHDIADAVAATKARGPRCDDLLRGGTCRRRVQAWGDFCYLHRRSDA